MVEEVLINNTIDKAVFINALPLQVWQALTIPALMNKWMSETTIEVNTNWQVGQPILIAGGWYKTRFENKGVVLQFDVARVLKYTHLSSLSRLPDNPESYTVVEFTLDADDNGTKLQLKLSNFPTDTIYRHFNFYWNVALVLLKRFVEEQMDMAQ